MVSQFNQLKELLLSQDLSRYGELDWIDSQGLRFLDGSDLGCNKVAFQSFPRSGNTMLRNYFESITGIFTGSDMPLDLTFPLQ